jgi:hypothetical protein
VRTVRYLIELAAFVALVWLATAGFRRLGGEPWASILHRPLWLFP